MWWLGLDAAGLPLPPGSSALVPPVSLACWPAPSGQSPLASLLALCTLFHTLTSCGWESWLKGLFRL